MNKDLIKLRNLCDFPKVLKEDQAKFYEEYDQVNKKFLNADVIINIYLR